MRLTDFDYELPAERIAQVPIEPRDASRLLVDRGSAEPDHRHVRDLPTLLADGDLLVVNDTRVIPARLRLQRHSGGAAEVLLLEPLSADRRTWEAMIRPARKLRIGERLVDSSGAELVEVGRRTVSGDTWTVTIVADGDALALLQTARRNAAAAVHRGWPGAARPVSDRVCQRARHLQPRRPLVCISPRSCWRR